MTLTTTADLGIHDEHRRGRLLEIASAIIDSRPGELTWPNQTDLMGMDARRDFTATGLQPTSAMTLGQQIRAHSAIARAGASFVTLPILQETRLPTIDRAAVATWGSDAADIFNGALDLTRSTPHRLSAFLTVSKQLLKTAPVLASSFIESQLLSAIGAAIDQAALIGTGVDDEPTGLLFDSGIAEHEMIAAAPGALDLIAMEKLLADSHGEGDPDQLRWVVDPATRAALRNLPRPVGTSEATWPDQPAGPLGITAVTSPWAPADTVILGNFGDLLVLQSGPIEIQPNPYSQDIDGFVRVLVNGFFDVIALNPSGSFVRLVTP